ncbi:gamma subclass chorismate mutase AroQ [Nonomuraea sp. NPDC050404]|uniref:gamma subclass chorismate mutase AroQ n=1 Tax=Nonomuraea sp. NPDC050404 TaxID=3155783 RepID=UPI0033C4F79C
MAGGAGPVVTAALVVAVLPFSLAPYGSSPGPAAAVAGPSVTERLAGLVDLTVRRLLLADEVAAAKFGGGGPITDPERERRLLDAVADLSERTGLARDTGVRFFVAQIEAAKVVQRGLHARWRADSALRPRQRPDLATEVRPRLDRLTLPMVRLLKETTPVRADTGRCRALLGLARLAAEERAGLDGLHREALGSALRPVCTP